MSRTKLTINNVAYTIARQNLLPKGGRQFTIDSRPWQPGDPAQKEVALWNVDGPQLYSYEQIAEGQQAGPLGIAYTDGADSRWSDTLCLGPAITSLTLTGSDTPHPMVLLDVNALLDQNTGLDGSPNPGNVVDIAWTQGATAGEYYAYFVRDGYVTKVNLASLTVVATHSFLDSAVAAIATQTPAATRELSVALASSAYQVAQPIASGADDTWTQNSAGQVVARFGQDSLRVVGMATNSGQVTVSGNPLTSTVTMAAPAWSTVTNIVGAQLSPTGFVLDGYRWVMGTTKGPYYIDPQLGQPYPLIPEMDNNSENRVLAWWSFLGVLIGTRYGTRWQKANIGRSFGVESFAENRTTVQGYATAMDASIRWIYQALYNPNTNTTWLLAWHPDLRELRQDVLVSPFVIGKFSGNAVSRAMRWVGTANQARTTQVLLMGNNTNGAYMIVGETPTEIDDSNYRYTTSGTAYFTELRRFPHLLKDIEAIEFESASCTANRTIGVALVVAGDAAQPATVTLAGTTAGVNDTISTNGYQRRLFVDNSGVPLTTVSSRRFYPQLTFTSNVATASPQVVGMIRVYYTLRPLLIDEITVHLQLQDDNISTAYDQALALDALQSAGPVLVQDDWYSNSYYVRVADLNYGPEAEDNGGSPDRPKDGGILVVTLKMHRWNVSGNGAVPA